MFLTFFMFLLCVLLNISRVFWKRFLRYILPSQISPRHCYRTSTSAKWNIVHKSSCSVALDKKKRTKEKSSEKIIGKIVGRNWRNGEKDEKTVFSCRCPCCLPVFAHFQIHQGLDQGPARPDPRPSAVPKCVPAPSWQHVCGNKMICQILHMAAFILKNICIL